MEEIPKTIFKETEINLFFLLISLSLLKVLSNWVPMFGNHCCATNYPEIKTTLCKLDKENQFWANTVMTMMTEEYFVNPWGAYKQEDDKTTGSLRY